MKNFKAMLKSATLVLTILALATVAAFGQQTINLTAVPTTYTAPVTYAARAAKKVTTSATSCGSPARPRGIKASICSMFLGVRAAVISVHTYPGTTTLAVTP